MAHYPKIFDSTGGITDITFNDFFNGMMQLDTGPLGEGWYRIIDYRTTGYVLDRYFSETRTYGCQGGVDVFAGINVDISDVYGGKYTTPIEPLIVFVSFDKKFGWNRHNHRVYSEAYPEDEIYWTWDFGIKWDKTTSDFPWTLNQTPTNQWRIEDRFDFDATLFSPNPNGYEIPLKTLEPFDLYQSIIDNKKVAWNYWRGYIYRREDTERNIKGSYDWRYAYLARYSSQDTLSNPWNASTIYNEGDFVVGDDNWLYVCLLNQNNINPILYDSFNDPAAVDQFGNSIYAPSVSGNMTPSSAYAPLSSRRAWLRLWPSTFNWYSPWANGGNAHGKVYFLGHRQLDPNQTPIQPSYIEIPCDPFPKYFRTFSGDNDGISSVGELINLTYIKNVDLGGPSWVPAGPEYIHPIDKNGKWISNFDSALGMLTNYPKDTIHPTNNYDMMSYVTDNHIITFEGIDPDTGNTAPNNTSSGNYLGGLIDGLKFGSNSAGNTFYVMPLDSISRKDIWKKIDNTLGITQGSTPTKRFIYGRGWRINGANQQIGGINLDTGDFTDIQVIEPLFQSQEKIDQRTYSFSEIDIWNESNFGGNDFGSNFIGNVFFGCLTHSSDNGFFNYGYPRIDNFELSENLDGVFCGNKFKNSNRYNLFLHGMKNCTIDSSEASIIETASDLHCKYSVNNFLRDIYGMKMDESRYNSIYHAINIESTGVIAHNYLDSLYCSTIEDGFMYNNISMYLPIDSAYFEVPWPYNGMDNIPPHVYKYGLYYESGFNHYGPGFTLNTIKGWALSNDFRAQFTSNYKRKKDEAWSWSNSPTYFEYNSFGEGIHANYIWNSVKASFMPISFREIEMGVGAAMLLNSDWNKEIKSNTYYDTGTNQWVTSSNPILNFTDDTGQEQYQLYTDTSIVPFASGYGPTPYPDF